MKKGTGLFLVAWMMASAGAGGEPADIPLAELLGEGGEDLVVERIPVNLEGASSGLFAFAKADLRELEQPPALKGYLIEKSGLINATDKGWKEKDYWERALKFKNLGLLELARAEFQFLARQKPADPSILKNLADLTAAETALHYRSALKAKEEGIIDLALSEVLKGLFLNPRHAELTHLKNELEKTKDLQKGLAVRVGADLKNGVSSYEQSQYDRALESFVRVLNMDPNNQQAMEYIQKIGERRKEGGVQ